MAGKPPSVMWEYLFTDDDAAATARAWCLDGALIAKWLATGQGTG
ncbi:hypothetical protein ACWDKQ_24210 [Saccharopolyspora sp. NPDC000995]